LLCNVSGILNEICSLIVILLLTACSTARRMPHGLKIVLECGRHVHIETYIEWKYMTRLIFLYLITRCCQISLTISNFIFKWGKWAIFDVVFERRTWLDFFTRRGFKVFYNRRYFLKRLRVVRGPGGGSSWNPALCRPKNVLQRLQNIKCFERKIRLTFSLEFRFHQDHA
jgi:hypothetical protein